MHIVHTLTYTHTVHIVHTHTHTPHTHTHYSCMWPGGERGGTPTPRTI